MKSITKHLEKLRKIKKKNYHHLQYKLHKKHNISKKTLFYIKEYGPNANVIKTIFKESIKILLLAALISSVGGMALENMKVIFLAIIPLIISIPVLNDMIGDYGIIMSSKFSTMLYENKIHKKWWLDLNLRKLLTQIIIISIIIAILCAFATLVISHFQEFGLNKTIITKILIINILDVIIITLLLFFITILAGFHFYKKNEDPNNFLVPITTAIADFGNMILLAILIKIFF